MERTMMLPMAAVLASAGLLGGCGNSATNTYNEITAGGPPEGLVVGMGTTVGVRPDVLGSARDLPVPAVTDTINGARVTVSGSLHSVDGTWIVLDDGGDRRWIRLENVVWLRQAKPAGGSTGAPSSSHGSHGSGGHG